MFPGAAVPEWLIELVQTTFKMSMSASKTPKRIYVSRADAATRRVANEAEVERLLQGYGFETVRLVDWSFTDQIELFSSAAAVVGPHGGGLTNLMFCRPGTKVLELFPAFNKSDVYWVLAEAMQLQYSYLKNPQERVAGRGEADFRVNLDDLRLALESMNLGAEGEPTKPDGPGNTDKALSI
jgi:capsular polysaccharide biosynthesis protein